MPGEKEIPAVVLGSKCCECKYNKCNQEKESSGSRLFFAFLEFAAVLTIAYFLDRELRKGTSA